MPGLRTPDIKAPKSPSITGVLSLGKFVNLNNLCTFQANHQTASLYAAGVCFITLILCLTIPESHIYYVNKNQIEKAKKSLSKILSIGEFKILFIFLKLNFPFNSSVRLSNHSGDRKTPIKSDFNFAMAI